MKFQINSRKGVWLGMALIVFMMVGLSGCAPKDNMTEGDKLNVTVSIVPQQYFVERIGGAYVDVNVMVGAGDAPHTYEPKPEQMRALSQSAAYFSIGVDFENVWLDKISAANPDMLMVDTIAQIERLPMEAEHVHEGEDAHEDDDDYAHKDDDDHAHKDDDDHAHEAGAPDPHVWLSPERVKMQSQTIYEALVQLDPEHKDAYKTNLDAFIEDIQTLDADIYETLSDLTNRKFMVFHPSWGYFAHDYDLEQIPIEVGGQEPSAQELAELIEHAQEEGIRVVFAQPEFSTQNAETIAQEIGGEVLLISPLASDWLGNMRQVAQSFADALKGE